MLQLLGSPIVGGDCGICHKAGMVYAVARAGGHKLFIRCSCYWGKDPGDEIPQWQFSMSRDFTTERVPLMRPDLSSLRKDPALAKLPDDDFLRHAAVASFMQNQMSQSIAWWRAQRQMAIHFWKDYFQEGMAT